MQSRSKLMKVASIAVIIGSTVAAILNYWAGDSIFPYAIMALVFAITEVVHRRRERRAE